MFIPKRSFLKFTLGLLISGLITSCWSENSKPDTEFMKKIEFQSSLDSSLKTTIELSPKKVNLGSISRNRIVNGSFLIKNKGDKDFNILEIKPNCDCIKIKYTNILIIKSNDSLLVNYSLDIHNYDRFISESIVVIGNCQFGNQTFIIQAFINQKIH